MATLTRFHLDDSSIVADALDQLVEVLDGPGQLAGAVHYLAGAGLAALVELLGAVTTENVEAPEWLAVGLGCLEGVTDDLQELLIYLDAHLVPMAPARVGPSGKPVPALCNARSGKPDGVGCLQALGHVGEVGSDHDNGAETWAPGDVLGVTVPADLHPVNLPPPALPPVAEVGADPRWRCTLCGNDGTNPVKHEDDYGHWPPYV